MSKSDQQPQPGAPMSPKNTPRRSDRGATRPGIDATATAASISAANEPPTKPITTPPARSAREVAQESTPLTTSAPAYPANDHDATTPVAKKIAPKEVKVQSASTSTPVFEQVTDEVREDSDTSSGFDPKAAATAALGAAKNALGLDEKNESKPTLSDRAKAVKDKATQALKSTQAKAHAQAAKAEAMAKEAKAKAEAKAAQAEAEAKRLKAKAEEAAFEAERSARPSIGELVGTASAQLSGLVKGEIALAKARAAEAGKRFGMAAGFAIVAGVLALYLLERLLRAAEFGLAEVLPMWASCLIVGGVLLLIILILLLLAKKSVTKAQKQVPNPQVGLKKDAQAVKEGMGK